MGTQALHKSKVKFTQLEQPWDLFWCSFDQTTLIHTTNVLFIASNHISPVMLPKEACVYLPVLFPKCFCWPEWKALQLSPDQRVWLTLLGTEQNISMPQMSKIWTLLIQYVRLCKDLHMAHKTSCPFFGMTTGSTPDTPQSHSSRKAHWITKMELMY